MKLLQFVPKLVYQNMVNPLWKAGRSYAALWIRRFESAPPQQERKRSRLRNTSPSVAAAAGHALASGDTTAAGRTAAASALAQFARPSVTRKRAAKAAGKALRASKTTPAGRRAAGSALSQRRKSAN